MQGVPAQPPLLQQNSQTLAIETPGILSQPLVSVTPSPDEVEASAIISPVIGERATYTVPTSAADGEVVELAADVQRVGWVNNDQVAVTAMSFPDFNVYAGTLHASDSALEDVNYMGAVGFDLSQLDAYGASTSAELLLFGLNEDNQRLEQGIWEVEVLASDRSFWESPSYTSLLNAQIALPLKQMDVSELGYNQIVRIPLDPAALALLNGLRYQIKSLTLRIRGPETADSLFGFDGGLGAGSLGNPPRLVISTEPVQPTPTPIIVTETPTPSSVEAAAALVLEKTRVAESIGTPTPTPYNVMTATPTEEGGISYWTDPLGTPVLVVVPTEVPLNQETAEAQVAYATAAAIATGTPTPLPERIVTATPTATPLYFIATVTPENVMTLAAELVAATSIAQMQGTPTPLPTNAVIISPTPRFIVVTSTPIPLNVATAQVMEAEATVNTLLTGTPTPTPFNQATATPLPPLIPLDFFTPTPTPSATITLPDQVPIIYNNKILFLSDRAGKDPVTDEDYRVFALDPVDGMLYSVNEPWVYGLAQEQLGLSPDRRFVALVTPDNNQVLQLHIYSFEYGDTRQLTTVAEAISYDPAWSPKGDRIAFVGTEPGNDEIYTIQVDGSEPMRLTQNTWEWDKHPSWSPDATQIVFWSNRETGRSQLWIMNADGTEQRNLSNNEYNDWAPIWVP